MHCIMTRWLGDHERSRNSLETTHKQLCSCNCCIMCVRVTVDRQTRVILVVVLKRREFRGRNKLFVSLSVKRMEIKQVASLCCVKIEKNFKFRENCDYKIIIYVTANSPKEGEKLCSLWMEFVNYLTPLQQNNDLVEL